MALIPSPLPVLQLFDGSLLVAVAVAAVIFLGALIQGAIGFGLGVLAAPIIVILAPPLIPVVVILLVVTLPLFSMLREGVDADWTGVTWALIGRVPGTVVGAYLVAVVSMRLLTVVVGLTVLLAVFATLLRWNPRLSREALLVAGFVSGFAGTAASIGGPPVALLYQRLPGPRLRGTMSAFLLIGGLLSIVALAVAGQIERDHVVAAILLGLPMVAGFGLSGPLRPHVDKGRTRALVLVVSAVSALTALVSAAQ